MRKVVPDGGWGWMVVLGAGLANMLNQSLVSVFGLIFGEELERMGHGTTGVALVMNINSMVTNFSGLFTGWALKRFSPRVVTFTGVCCTTIGMISTSFTTNIVQLIITYSILTGLGLGLIMPSTFVAINSYFGVRRSQAVGLSMAGTGIGQMVMPQVVRVLLDNYGYRGATLILGALSLNGAVGALLFQPVQWHMKSVPKNDEENFFGRQIAATEKTSLLLKEQKRYDNVTDTDDTALKQLDACHSVTTSDNESQKDRSPTETQPPCAQSCYYLQVIANTLGLRMLRDGTFVHIIVGLALVYTCSISFSMLLPFLLIMGRGLSRGDTAVCMSALSGADIVARVTVPVIARRLRVSNRVTFLVGAFLIALARALLVIQDDFLSILLSSALCGYIRAASVINQNLTISEYSDPADLPAALGLNMVAKGFLVLSVGQFFGWIRDYTNSFSFCIFFQSAIMILVAISWTVELTIKKMMN